MESLVTRELAKALLCGALALGSLCAFAAVSGKPWETKVLRRSVVAVTVAKAVLGLALYLSLPAAFFASDAALYYLPETLRWLSGEIPYRDFRSAYSPLFHVLLMPAVLIWPNPGSVVATLFALEIALIALYARRFGRARPVQTWRVLFLYAFSPISFYWVALTGYNSVLIALFTLIALLLAEARRDFSAGLAALLGLAFSKLTMVVAWPAIVLFPRGSAVRRIAPLLALAIFVPMMISARIDILADAMHGRYLSTSGNLWFLVSAMLSESVESRPIKLASMLSLLFSEAILVYAYLRRTRSPDEAAFDRASAFYSACALAFMLFAYKAYPWYLTMCLIFLLHTLVCSGRSSVAALVPFALLGGVTTLEPALSVGLRSAVGTEWLPAVVALDLVVIGCVAYYALLCIRIALAAPSDPLAPRARRIGLAFRVASAPRGKLMWESIAKTAFSPMIIAFGFMTDSRFVSRVSKNIGLSLLSLFVGLAFCEGFFRAVGYDFAREEEAWRKAPIFYRQPIIPTGEVFFRRPGPEEWSGQVINATVEQSSAVPNPYINEPVITVRYNRTGFRNPDNLSNWDIVVTGDSFTELGHLRDEELFTTMLGRLLNLRVLNLGVSNTGPLTQLSYLRDYGVSKNTRNAVTVFFEGNDLIDLDREYEDLVRWREGGQRPDREFKRQTSLVKAIYRRYQQSRLPVRTEWTDAYFKSPDGDIPVTLRYTPPGRADIPDERLRRLEYFLREYAKLGMEQRISVWLAYMPSKERVLHGEIEFTDAASDELRNWRPTDFPELISELCGKYGIHFIDLTPALVEETRNSMRLVYNSLHDSHLNSLGSEVVAQELARHLRNSR